MIETIIFIKFYYLLKLEFITLMRAHNQTNKAKVKKTFLQ